MNKDKAINNIQISLSDNPPPLDSPLKDGNFVFVRILQAKGNGQYLVSFAGNTFLVKSKENWKEGSSFKAQISIKDNTLFLINKEETNSKDLLVNNFSTFQRFNNSSLSEQLATYLTNIGVKPDIISLELMQYFVQHEMKIDINKINKAHSFASLVPGKEKECTQIALLLLEKNLPCNEQIILQLLLYIQGDFSKNTDENTEDNKSESFEQNKDNLLNIIFPDENFTNKKEGLLTLVNHIKNGRLNWVIIPFEGDNIKGSIRFLLDTETKKTKYINILYKTQTKTYKVKIRKINSDYKIQFCTLPKPNIQEKKKFERKIIEINDIITNTINIQIEYNENLELDGLFTENKELSIIEDTV